MPVITPYKLRQARKKLGLQQVKMAEILGVTQSVISKWEAGKVFPRDPERVALAYRL